MKPGDLVVCDAEPEPDSTHRWTILTRHPDQFDIDNNPEVYSVRKGEVGIVLAIIDVAHSSGGVYNEALVLFGEGLGWNTSSAFKTIG